jgi:hypothetical protein
MKAVMRSYCVFVLLDRPRKPSFYTLLRLRGRARLVWFTPCAPFWARLLGICVKPLPKDDTWLLWELSRLPDRSENKMLTLIPLSERAHRFIQKHKELLEISYRFERKNK